MQATEMRRDGLLPFGWEIEPEMLNICNPIFILTLLPLLQLLFDNWPGWLFNGHPPHTLTKMGTGTLICGTAFLWSALLQHLIDISPSDSVCVLWQVPQFFLITVAEVLVSPVSLDHFYSEA